MMCIKRSAFIVLVLLPFTLLAQSREEMLASYNFKRGYELFNDEGDKNEEALSFFQAEVRDHPKNGYSYYYMTIIYDQADQEGKALEYSNKAVELLKKDKEWLPYAYRLRASVELQLKDEAAAQRDWKAALKINPKDEETLWRRAEYYYEKEEYAAAEADYDAIIAANPGSTIGYIGKGRNAIARKDYAAALKLLDHAVILDPSFAKAYAFRAESYIALERYGEAADDLITSIGLDANMKAYFLMYSFPQQGREVMLSKLRIQQAKDKYRSTWAFLRGNLLEVSEDWSEAIAAYEDCLEQDPDDITYKRLAHCYAELGQYNRALTNINHALAMDSTSASNLLGKSNYLYELGRTDEALATLDAYIAEEPDDYFGYYSKGFFEYLTGHYSAAIRDFSMTLVLKPDYVYAITERAFCYRKTGDEEAAREGFIETLRVSLAADSLFPGNFRYDDPANLNYLSYDNDCQAQYAYYGLGLYDLARAVEDNILANNSDKGNYYDAACLYALMGEGDRAMGYLRTALEKGFRRLTHIQNDADLDLLKNRADFRALMAEYRARVDDAPAYATSYSDAPTTGSTSSGQVSEIPFTRDAGGLCRVQCSINGLPLSFWLDTGASTVSLSMVEATFMYKNGYLGKDDIVGTSYFLDANGNVSEGTVINLRRVAFGDRELTNVKASVVGNLNAPLLLGQSVLARLGTVEIDNARRVIRIKPVETIKSVGSITFDKGSAGSINIDDLKTGQAASDRNVGSAPQAVAAPQAVEKSEVMDNNVVSVPASFPGGEVGLIRFISTHIKYPEIDQKMGVQGTVLIRFKVDVDGSVSSATVRKSLSRTCDAAALAVVRQLPRFTPAQSNGKPVPVWFNLPVKFSLE